MKRGEGLQRRTPLKSGGKPLARGKGIGRQCADPKPAKAKPRRKTGKHIGEAHARATVRERSGGRCEVANRAVCTGRAAEWSHRKNRSQGGRWTPANGLDACSPCHLWITEHPVGAREKGWNVSREADPLRVPVWTVHGLVVLDDVGGLTPSLPLDDVA